MQKVTQEWISPLKYQKLKELKIQIRKLFKTHSKTATITEKKSEHINTECENEERERKNLAQFCLKHKIGEEEVYTLANDLKETPLKLINFF